MDVDRQTEMNLSPKEICVLLLHQFLLGHKATKNICKTMDQDVISTPTAHRWFNRFNNENYELDDSSRSDKPVEVDLDRFKQLIEDDPRLMTRCLAEQPGCSHATVETYFNELRKTWKYELWIPYQLSTYQLQHRLNLCLDLLTSYGDYEWLRKLVTGDERWLLYINYVHKRQWLSVDQTLKNDRPSEESDVKRLVECERNCLLVGVIGWMYVTAGLYYQQLDRVAEKVKGKRDRVYF